MHSRLERQTPILAQSILPSADMDYSYETRRPRKPLLLVRGTTFLSTNPTGDIVPLAEKDTGLFLSDTRYVSKLEILANGNPPVFRSRRELRNGYAAWTELAIAAPNRVEHNDLKDSTVSVLRRQILDDSSLTDSLCFENRGPETFRLSVVLNVAADFVDLFELLGHPRRRFGCHHTPQINGTQLTFAYTGVDAKIRKTCFRFGQVPQTINPGSASWSIALEGSHSVTLGWTVKFGEDTRTVLGELMTTGSVRCEALADRDLSGLRSTREMLSRLRAEAARWETSSTQWASADGNFNGWLRRSSADLYALRATFGSYPGIVAGIPRYATLFPGYRRCSRTR